MRFNAISLAAQTRYLIQLAKAGETTSFLTIANDLKPMAAQHLNPV